MQLAVFDNLNGEPFFVNPHEVVRISHMRASVGLHGAYTAIVLKDGSVVATHTTVDQVGDRLNQAMEANTPADKLHRVVLTNRDFRNLVRGNEVTLQATDGARISIILADIGFGVMRRSIQEAELDAALETE